MADESRRFVIPVRRTWLLLILPILATLYFIAVVLLVVMDWRIRGVSEELLVLTGVGIFALVFLIEFPFLFRKRVRAPRVEAPREDVLEALDPQTPAPSWDDELVITQDQQQGLAVLEYSAPAKSRNRNAVYTKTMVPVSAAHVLRVESLVADQHDL